MSKSEKTARLHRNPLINWALNGFVKKIAAPIRNEQSPAKYTDVFSQECSIPMPDGVKLHGNICLPQREGKFPVVLIRNPYVSNSIIFNGALPVFAEQGYAAVLVEVRGTLNSEGDWLPFVHEREDGRAVIDWIVAQPWCDGNIGAFGASYLGHTQWAIADYHHPALKTLFISVYGAAPYHTFYRRGMFRQEIWTQWATQMMGDNRRKLQLPPKLVPKAMAFRPQIKLGEELKGEPCTWYNDWITNTNANDPYWSEGFWGEFEESVRNINIPIFLHGGWFDIFLRPQLEAFRNLPQHVLERSRFLIGPWNHGGMPVGDMEFPNQSVGDFLFVKSALEWFDAHLKGKPYSKPVGVVEAYDIGSGSWKTFNYDIYAQEQMTLYLAEAQKLETVVPKVGKTMFVYDPQQPAPSIGGNLLGSGGMSMPGGAKRLPEIDARSDVISFVSDLFERDLHIAGKICAELYVSSDAAATAFTVTVSEVNANGEAIHMRDDITDIRWRDEGRVEDYIPGKIVKLDLEMLDVVWTVKSGSRIRVDISSSNFPMYHIHPNTDKPWADETASPKAKQCIYFGNEYPTRIMIPILESDK